MLQNFIQISVEFNVHTTSGNLLTVMINLKTQVVFSSSFFLIFQNEKLIYRYIAYSGFELFLELFRSCLCSSVKRLIKRKIVCSVVRQLIRIFLLFDARDEWFQRKIKAVVSILKSNKNYSCLKYNITVIKSKTVSFAATSIKYTHIDSKMLFAILSNSG